MTAWDQKSYTSIMEVSVSETGASRTPLTYLTKTCLYSPCLFTHLFFGISSDIDECMEGTAQCHSNATCMNTMGSYTCTCDYGYTGNGFDCAGKTCFFNVHRDIVVCK